MNIELSKNADYVICSLYKTYLQRRDSGMTKLQSVHFNGADEIRHEYFSDMHMDDIVSACIELDDVALLDCFRADNTVYDISLTTNAIIYMENRFKNKVNSVVDFISKIKSSIPFI